MQVFGIGEAFDTRFDGFAGKQGRGCPAIGGYAARFIDSKLAVAQRIDLFHAFRLAIPDHLLVGLDLIGKELQ